MKRIFLSLGSNLGDRRASLEKAAGMISRQAGLIVRRSAVYETEPWAETPGSDFLNMVLEIETILHPAELLDILHSIEAGCGRVPTLERYAPRIVDIDILFYGKEVIALPQLVVPHPVLHLRRFVLVPLTEIAPRWKHPETGVTMAELLRRCPDPKGVWKCSPSA
jgi:2-amino-4-hydroxy-6-hydroxymethyldihydropteridine diphosphokinase